MIRRKTFVRFETESDKLRQRVGGEIEADTKDVAHYRMNGRFAYYKIGGKLLYKEKDILVLLEKNRVETFDHW